MKTLLALFLALALLSGCNQTKTADKSNQTPKEMFKTSNPDAMDVVWETDGDFTEVDFIENGIKKSMVYDAEGNIVESEMEINIDQLPEAITTYITTTYVGAEIEGAELLENTEGNFYEVEIENQDDQELELLFSSEGNFIKETIEADDDDEGEENEENEVEIEISELPGLISQYISQNYGDYSITEAEMVTTAEGIFYEVELTGVDDIEIDLVFDHDGNFIRIEED